MFLKTFSPIKCSCLVRSYKKNRINFLHLISLINFLCALIFPLFPFRFSLLFFVAVVLLLVFFLVFGDFTKRFEIFIRMKKPTSSFYLKHLSISNIFLSQTSLYLKHLSISNITLQTSPYLKHPSVSTYFSPRHFSISNIPFFYDSLYLKYHIQSDT